MTRRLSLSAAALLLALLAVGAGRVAYDLTARSAWPEVFVSVRAPHVGTCSGRLMVRHSWPRAAGYCVGALFTSATPTALPNVARYGP